MSNQLTSTPGASYTYDNNGNTVTKVVGSNTTSYAWDFENRMSSVTLPGSGGTVSFKYDPFGRRIYKSSSSGTSVFAYDGDNLIEETNSAGTVVGRYTQTQEIDEPLAMLRSGATSYYHADGLGSVTSLSNSAGAIANTYTYDSFGKLTASTGSITNSFRFTGREFDAETNLQFSRARYYDPNAGRFLSQDPIGFNGGVNAYAYVQNNSPTFADPLGLKKTCTPLGDPLQITPWMKWANGPPIPIGGWQYAGTGPAEGGAESGANGISCVWTRKVKQPISRHAYFLQEYRCVNDDPSKCGSTEGPWGPIPNNVTIEYRLGKKTKRSGFEESTERKILGPFNAIASDSEMLDEYFCKRIVGAPK